MAFTFLPYEFRLRVFLLRLFGAEPFALVILFYFFNYLVSAVGTRQRISVEIPCQTISNSGRLPPTIRHRNNYHFPFSHSTWLPSVPTACSPTHITACSSTWHGSTRPVCQENPASYFEVHPKSLREDTDCWTFSQTNALAYARKKLIHDNLKTLLYIHLLACAYRTSEFTPDNILYMTLNM